MIFFKFFLKFKEQIPFRKADRNALIFHVSINSKLYFELN
jgi:hypothetical protein